MYNPQKFRSADMTEAFEMMDSNPFANLIVVADGKPFISHLPLTPKKEDEKIVLIGHMARAKPQWKFFAKSEVTAIFHGPHTYVTPVWYAQEDVPTWNYSVLHATGKAEILEGEKLVDGLKELSSQSERHWPSGWQFSIPEDLSGASLSKHIVGFKIPIDKLDYKKKLSQNRTPADRAGVMKGLASRSDDGSRLVLSAMQKIYSPEGEPK